MVPRTVRRPAERRPYRAARSLAAGPAVVTSRSQPIRLGEAACGIRADGLEVLDQDWEEAFFVEKCPGCFAAVLADGRDEQDRLGRR